MNKLGIIAGIALPQLTDFHLSHETAVKTPHGNPSATLHYGELAEKEVVFLRRDGEGHQLTPHQINNQANLWALRDAGVDAILSVSVVMALESDYALGELVVPHQLIDYSSRQQDTFLLEDKQSFLPYDFSQPFAEDMRQTLLAASHKVGENIRLGGVVATMSGPRLPTAAEVMLFSNDGCDLMSMQLMPEVALAREIQIPYAHLALVSHLPPGRSANLSREALLKLLAERQEVLNKLIVAYLQA